MYCRAKCPDDSHTKQRRAYNRLSEVQKHPYECAHEEVRHPRRILTDVKNIHGTSEEPFQIDDLKQKYEKLVGAISKYCQVVGCRRVGTATAHVYLHESTHQNWFLTRLCSYHNSSDYEEAMAVPTNTLIPVCDVRKL